MKKSHENFKKKSLINSEIFGRFPKLTHLLNISSKAVNSGGNASI